MQRRILIDASYKEEVRLVLCEKDIIEEFDYQNSLKKIIKGNIYLAKIDKVEPSLQAAFINYGGEKHGFLPFSEIHHSYYQISEAKKQELLKKINASYKKLDSEELNWDEDSEDERKKSEFTKKQKIDLILANEVYKNYRIQDVIKKDQAILVQVVKEERGNKGASLTTYLSLAGRYCVFMPNTNKPIAAVSKRIDDNQERERLKKLITELTEKEPNSSLIVRTAGSYKTKTEIKRDYVYLSRLYSSIEEHASSSIAPAFIYEEGDIIKKTIRDIYDSEVEEIVVSGKEAYSNALEFMKLVLPRHVDKVKEYKGRAPIFSYYNIEEQISLLYDNVVPLSSGGYLVINQTEALVAIDVNSGKSTNEQNIESTATKTNLEAINEIARQIKLRDLSGLIVIDFIDMEEAGNRTAVEDDLRKALSRDRARTQIGRISEFGLLEMTRQRLRNSIIETSFVQCQSCNGRGKTRAISCTSTAILRAVHNDVSSIKNEESILEISASNDVVMYLMNYKKEEILKLENDFHVKLVFSIDIRAGIDGFFIEYAKINSAKPNEALSSIVDTPYNQKNIIDVNSVNNRNNTEESGTQRRYNTDSSNKAHVKDKADKSSHSNHHPEDVAANYSENSNQPKNKNYKRKRRARNNNPNLRKNYSENNNTLDNNQNDNLKQSNGGNKGDKNSLFKKIWNKIID